MKILLADDEPEILGLYRDILKGNGHEVVTASSGYEALECLDTPGYDLAVLDLYMPDLTGFEVLARIKKENRSVPVIVMTGHYPDAEVQTKIQEFEVVSVLRKPVMITTLLSAVQKVASRLGAG